MVRVGILGKGAKGASKSTGAEGPRQSGRPTLADETNWGTDVAAAREKHSTLVNQLNSLRNDIRSSSDTLERLSTGFGTQAEWKKLDGTCVDKVSGE